MKFCTSFILTAMLSLPSLANATATNQRPPPTTFINIAERLAPNTDPASQIYNTAYNNTAFITATTNKLSQPEPSTPTDLKNRIAKGGLIIIHRYTGSGGRDGNAIPGSMDDGQRISEKSTNLMQQLGNVYTSLNAPISAVWSSEYYFVYQHALAAMGKPVIMNRDLTGSLYFRDNDELQRSLQGLRNRTVTPPPAGTNIVLFTHQGKFDKAYGYYLNPGQTIIFQPDGSGKPNVIANLTLDEWLALANE
ncbi:hypothetical protein [Otariodibacter oris]|uniref:Histidine phosphatase superfamily protein (Branch 1) n=1 Tax=Otariodibacter oris TaxID=1032623 RepID=A0A420XHU6_9PAST|nr:hypothetical protein [Otariodibacter oris]QGM80912.1 hypothetical protein A6A10_05605 [Otariodibacter oris]RKR76912.1 hypothetical protein DES31_0221 [Otariodibacter oris]